jgi:hypothetical protein
VLTVVAEEAIAILAEAGAGAIDDFPRVILHRRATPDGYRSPAAEFLQRNFLHRSPG